MRRLIIVLVISIKFETSLKMCYIFTLNLCLIKNDYITVKTLTFSLQDEFVFFIYFFMGFNSKTRLRNLNIC